MAEYCSACGRVFASSSKPQTCERCKKNYHSSCTKFQSARIDESIVKVCAPCIAEANPGAVLSRSNSGSSGSSLGDTRGNSRSGTLPLLGSKQARPSQEILAALGAMNSKLEKIDDISTKVNSIDSRVTSIDTRVASLVDRVTSIETSVEGISSRVDTVENRLESLQASFDSAKDESSVKLAELQAEQDSMKQRVNVLEDARLEGGSSDEADKERIQALEASNTALISQVQRLEIKQVQLVHSADVVIGGLTLDGTADPLLAALAVIKTIMPDFDDKDILSARLLPSKKRTVTSNVPASTPAVDTPTTSTNSTAASSQSESQSEGENRSITGTLLVTLSSATMAKNVISAKTVWKKLTTVQLLPNLVSSAGIKLPDRPAVINVNEYLPKETYMLRAMVYKKSRDKTNNFVSFMKGALSMLGGRAKKHLPKSRHKKTWIVF